MTRAPIVLITQRVVTDMKTGERRDALDQQWAAFLSQAGYVGIAMPNNPQLVDVFIRNLKPTGILLTGGNDLVAYGGDAPERDAVETNLLEHAIQHHVPLLGVCRGMQIIQHHFGVPLKHVDGHVQKKQTVDFCGKAIAVNSYHNFGTADSNDRISVDGRSSDGIVKAITVEGYPIRGIMWHPERLAPFREQDIDMMRALFTPLSVPSALASLPNALQALA